VRTKRKGGWTKGGTDLGQLFGLQPGGTGFEEALHTQRGDNKICRKQKKRGKNKLGKGGGTMGKKNSTQRGLSQGPQAISQKGLNLIYRNIFRGLCGSGGVLSGHNREDGQVFKNKQKPVFFAGNGGGAGRVT